MTAELSIERLGRLGRIVLDRPQAINALSREMIDGIVACLEAWRDDDDVRAVLFEGNGERGFCSGGDVRFARELVLSGRLDAAADYFAAEYRMDGVVAAYPKPVVALTHGVVMGGGIGIASHAGFRFTAADARFAMPEAGIGFFSDVGVTAILARAPPARALLFLMSGLPVGPADALELGLADCAVPRDRFDALRAGIVAAAAAASVETALVNLMRVEALPPGEAGLTADAGRLPADAVAGSAETLVAAVAAAADVDPGFAPLAEALAARSPTSLVASFAAFADAKRRPSVADVLARDCRLAALLGGLPDFAEGVRAVLVDRDRRPRWQPPGFAGVPGEAIAAAIAGAAKPARDVGVSTS
jgi:enoyl-CoA hydratase